MAALQGVSGFLCCIARRVFCRSFGWRVFELEYGGVQDELCLACVLTVMRLSFECSCCSGCFPHARENAYLRERYLLDLFGFELS